jgi:hypothetical protein
MGYLAGPGVSIIDTLGLTDAFIARLPREYLVSAHPRPGHPDKRIPLSYLIDRGDVSILPGWEAAIERRDCSLSAQLSQYEPGFELYTPEWEGFSVRCSVSCAGCDLSKTFRRQTRVQW